MDNKKLQDQLEIQSRLIARISHSLRTPITAVLGISEVMLHDEKLPAHIEEAFKRIQNSGKIMLGVANDIINIKKLKNGELALASTEYDVAAMISEITQLHLIHLGSRQIEYKIEISPKIPATLVGDEFRIKQILDNLLANAFMHTETGMIKLTADWKRTESKKGYLVLDLTDTGIRDTTQNDMYGISIIKEIAETLDAKIEVKEGKGTNIKVLIPQEKTLANETIGTSTTKNLSRFQSTQNSQNTIEPIPMPYGKALVVDDVEACLFLVKGLLGFYEIQTELASNGHEVIEKISDGNEYDIIFMDHLMPGMDGATATKALREMGYNSPIVALTANAFGTEEEYKKIGFDAYISKPINPEEFDSVLHKYIRSKQPKPVLDAAEYRGFETKKDKLIKPEDNHKEVKEILRKDFAKKQKSVYKEITIALSNGNIESAKWLLDIIKNMAGMIDEPILTKVASDVSTTLSNGEIPTNLLEMLNQELTKVLAGIPQINDINQTPLTYSETNALFSKVQELLESDSAECTFLIDELQLIQGSEELVRHIENFDFPKALESLEIIRNVTPKPYRSHLL